MLVDEAKRVARQWVEAEASKMPGFVGAFIFGSVNWMSDDQPFPLTSDLDVRVVLDTDEPPNTFTKFSHDTALLEISFCPLERIKSPEAVLADYPSAAHFTRPCILADPTGHLGRIQAVVAEEFPRRKWVEARVEAVRHWQLASADRLLNKADPIHDQAFAWIYATSMFSHVILVADLKNPTVRKSLVAAREVLVRYSQLAFHESVLELLGSASLSQQRVEELFENLVTVFETAKTIRKTDFFGSSTISDVGRSTALGGTEELVDLGYHREATFWMLVIHTWCQKILHNDATPDQQARFMPAYVQLLDSLGVESPEDIYRRIEQVKALRPQADAVVEDIMARNADIIH
jgi:hypothetical protein